MMFVYGLSLMIKQCDDRISLIQKWEAFRYSFFLSREGRDSIYSTSICYWNIMWFPKS